MQVRLCCIGGSDSKFQVCSRGHTIIRVCLQHFPGWVVGRDEYYKAKPERPGINHTDPRRISLW